MRINLTKLRHDVMKILTITIILAAYPIAALSGPLAVIEVPLKNAGGDEVGIATITETKKGIEIEIDARGLPPGEHGFHVHEKGDCVGPSFESAGDHYNPSAKEHGKKSKMGSHAGDFENLKVKKDGTIKTKVMAKNLTLLPGAQSLRKELGTALIIHEKADDHKSQPSGNAGARIACGIIPPPAE